MLDSIIETETSQNRAYRHPKGKLILIPIGESISMKPISSVALAVLLLELMHIHAWAEGLAYVVNRNDARDTIRHSLIPGGI